MNRKIILLLFALCFGGMMQAQQLPQITQYMINNYAVNPAVAGMQDYYQVKTSIRNQWVGIVDAPRTTVLSIYGKKSEHVGLGGLVFNDQVGPTSRIGGSISYTYHFPVSRSVNLAFALSGGLTQFGIDKNGWNLLDTDDPFMQGNKISRSVPDATFGFNMYAKNWYIGASIPQLLSNNINLIDEDFYRDYNQESEGSLARHYFVLGAYTHKLNAFWSLEPSLLFKTVAPTTQLDVGLKAIYNEKLWGGLNYRDNGDMAALLGYSIQERFLIGYSYDIINSNLSGYSSGSHEFMLGIRFSPANESEIIE